MDPLDTSSAAAARAVRAHWERRGFWSVSGVSLFLIFGAYVPIPAVLGSYLWNDLQQLEGPMPPGLMVGAGVVAAMTVGIFPLLFYTAFGSYRYTPTEDGLTIRTILGKRHFRWDQVRSARLSQFRESYMVQLRLGPLRLGHIFLNDFRRPRSLLDALRAVLPVPIVASEDDLALIRDP